MYFEKATTTIVFGARSTFRKWRNFPALYIIFERLFWHFVTAFRKTIITEPCPLSTKNEYFACSRYSSNIGNELNYTVPPFFSITKFWCQTPISAQLSPSIHHFPPKNQAQQTFFVCIYYRYQNVEFLPFNLANLFSENWSVAKMVSFNFQVVEFF